MVQSRKVELEVKIEVDMPLDIINDTDSRELRTNWYEVFRMVYTSRVFHSGSIKLILKSSSGFTYQL
jgi:hypothetical protein